MLFKHQDYHLVFNSLLESLKLIQLTDDLLDELDVHTILINFEEEYGRTN